MYIAQTKGRLLRAFLIALILAFFSFPVVTYFVADCKIPSYYPKKITSVLVVFFR